MGEARQKKERSLLIAGGGEALVEENITHNSTWQLSQAELLKGHQRMYFARQEISLTV